MKNIAIITGASSGLGRDFALQLDQAREVDEIILIARRNDRLEALAKELKHSKGIVYNMDLTEEGSVQKFFKTLEESDEKKSLKWLINNAGFGNLEEFKKSDLGKNLNMIQLNISSLVEMTHRSLPYLKENSKIIQVASSAGFAPLHYFAVYAATKAFVLNFSRALSSELKSQRISVTAVCPGPVSTEFFDNATKDSNTKKSGTMNMADSQKVVKKALKDARNNSLTSVYGIDIKAFVFMTRLLPTKWILKMSKLVKGA